MSPDHVDHKKVVVQSKYTRNGNSMMKLPRLCFICNIWLLIDSVGSLVASGMVSAHIPGERGPGSSPGRGHREVFLGKTLNSYSTFLHPGAIPENCWGNLTNRGE